MILRPRGGSSRYYRWRPKDLHSPDEEPRAGEAKRVYSTGLETSDDTAASMYNACTLVRIYVFPTVNEQPCLPVASAGVGHLCAVGSSPDERRRHGRVCRRRNVVLENPRSTDSFDDFSRV